jgi:hypothetical protein
MEIRQAAHVARKRKLLCAQTFRRNAQIKTPLGIPQRRRDNNIKIYHLEIRYCVK